MENSRVKHKLCSGVPVLVNKICFFNVGLADVEGVGITVNIEMK